MIHMRPGFLNLLKFSIRKGVERKRDFERVWTRLKHTVMGGALQIKESPIGH